METLQRTANRGSVSTGYDVDNSLKLEADNTEIIYRANESGTNRKTFTTSLWFKRTELGATQEVWHGGRNGELVGIGMITYSGFADQLWIDIGGGTGNTGTLYRSASTQKIRDTSAWYHVVLAVDTTQGTEANRMKVWLNGVEVTSWAQHQIPVQDYQSALEAGADMAWGGFRPSNSELFSGYLAECHYLDGVAKVQTDFGEYDEDSGIWIPKKYTGTYGNNGCYMKYDDSSALGADSSGNGNTFTLVNIAAADQATDTPTNNFCTLNPLSYNVPYTATEGNTKMSKSDTTYGLASGTHYVGAGKWYWEIKATDFGTYSSCAFGILDAAKTTVGPSENGYEDPSLAVTNPEILAMTGSPNGWVMNSSSTISNNGSTNSVDYTFNEGDIIAIALDMDNGGYWFGNSRYSGVANGSFWVAPGGTSTSGSVATTDPANGNYALVGDGGGTNNGTPNFNGGTITGGSLLTAGFTLVTPLLGAYHSNTTVTLEVNFGGFTSYGEDGGYSDANGHGNFAYAVPSGFYSLCSKNIGEFGGSG